MRGTLLIVSMILLAAPASAADRDINLSVPRAEERTPAEQRSDALDQLFARLHRVSDEDDAETAEQGIWKIWMTSDSPTAEVLLQQAARAMNDGALPEALTILDRLVGAYPDFSEAWNKRATLYFMLGRYKDSLADIDRVLDLEPRHFGALSGRGMILRQQKNYSAAVDAFNDALAVNPNLEQVKDAIHQIEKIERGI